VDPWSACASKDAPQVKIWRSKEEHAEPANPPKRYFRQKIHVQRTGLDPVDFPEVEAVCNVVEGVQLFNYSIIRLFGYGMLRISRILSTPVVH